MNKWIIGLIALVVLAGGWFYFGQSQVDNSNPIKIGAMLLLSGDFTSYGEAAKAAIELAIDEYNQDPKHTKKIEIIYEDTKADPKTAVSAYQKLVSVDKVDVLLGPMLQVEMSAVAPLVKKDHIPIFSVSNPDQALRGTLSGFLSFWPDPTLEAEQMATFVYGQGVRTIAIVGTKDSWEAEVSEAFNKKFTALGGKVVYQELVLPDEADVSSTVTKALSQKPEAIFFGTYYRFTQFVRKVGEQGFLGRLYSAEIDTNLSEETKPYSNGLLFISPEFYSDDFIEAFVEKTGTKPTLPSGQVHDAAQVLVTLVSETNNREDLIQRMNTIQEFSGVSGEIRFTDDRRATFPLNIFEIEDGQINRVK